MSFFTHTARIYNMSSATAPVCPPRAHELSSEVWRAVITDAAKDSFQVRSGPASSPASWQLPADTSSDAAKQAVLARQAYTAACEVLAWWLACGVDLEVLQVALSTAHWPSAAVELLTGVLQQRGAQIAAAARTTPDAAAHSLRDMTWKQVHVLDPTADARAARGSQAVQLTLRTSQASGETSAVPVTATPAQLKHMRDEVRKALAAARAAAAAAAPA